MMATLFYGRSIKTNPKRRPLGVTVVALFLLLMGGVSIVSCAYLTATEPVTLRMENLVYIILPFFLTLARMVSGIALLKGFNWGRLLFLLAEPVLALIYLQLRYSIVAPKILYIVFYFIILYFLTRPTTLSFFRGDAFHRV